jgi:protein SCO1/2
VGKATYTGKADIGGPWLLYDTKGNAVTHKNFQGKYYLIYFGFTMCPDVCPISLQKVAKAFRRIKKSKEYNYFDLEMVFVSIDPDRDSNE